MKQPCFQLILWLNESASLEDTYVATDNLEIFKEILAGFRSTAGGAKDDVLYLMEYHIGVLYVIFRKPSFGTGDIDEYKRVVDKKLASFPFGHTLTQKELDDVPNLYYGLDTLFK